MSSAASRESACLPNLTASTLKLEPVPCCGPDSLHISLSYVFAVLAGRTGRSFPWANHYTGRSGISVKYS